MVKSAEEAMYADELEDEDEDDSDDDMLGFK